MKQNRLPDELEQSSLEETQTEQSEQQDRFIAIGKTGARPSVNKFDRFWLKVWAVICAAVVAISNAINKVIALIFRRKAPDKYVRAFVSCVLIILAIMILAAPFNITINKIQTMDVFSDNLIAVQRYVGTDEQNRPVYKWGFADRKGKVRIDCIYDDVMQFAHGVAWVHLVETNADGLRQSYWTLINTKGKRVSDATFMQVDDRTVPVKPFASEIRYAGVNQGGKWGFVNTKGKVVISCVYDEVGTFDEAIARVRKGGSTMYIDTKGRTVSSVYQGGRDFACGLAAVYRDGNWGFINARGEEIVPLMYDEVSDFKSGYAMIVSRGEGGLSYGIIDSIGRTVVPTGSFVDVAWREYFGL